MRTGIEYRRIAWGKFQESDYGRWSMPPDD